MGGQGGAIDWDVLTLERRSRVAGRVAAYVAILAGIALIIALLTIALAPSLGVMITTALIMWLVLSVLAVATFLVGEHIFLLEPNRYFAWLRELGPYEPESPGGQHVARFLSLVRNVGAVMVSAFVGAQVSQSGPSGIVAYTVSWLVILLVLGIIFVWWTDFLSSYAAHHLRAIRGGILPVRTQGGPFLGVFLLFTALWSFGVVALVLLFWVGSEALRAYGFSIQ